MLERLGRSYQLFECASSDSSSPCLPSLSRSSSAWPPGGLDRSGAWS